jgi:hypothetical protein
MSITSEQHTSAGEAHLQSHSACASCSEAADQHDHDHDHEHGFELVEVLRVVFVALVSGGLVPSVGAVS